MAWQGRARQGANGQQESAMLSAVFTNLVKAVLVCVGLFLMSTALTLLFDED